MEQLRLGDLMTDKKKLEERVGKMVECLIDIEVLALKSRDKLIELTNFSQDYRNDVKDLTISLVQDDREGLGLHLFHVITSSNTLLEELRKTRNDVCNLVRLISELKDQLTRLYAEICANKGKGD